MSTTAARLQKQLDALASFCGQHQLTSEQNKIMIFLKLGVVMLLTLC